MTTKGIIFGLGVIVGLASPLGFFPNDVKTTPIKQLYGLPNMDVWRGTADWTDPQGSKQTNEYIIGNSLPQPASVLEAQPGFYALPVTIGETFERVQTNIWATDTERRIVVETHRYVEVHVLGQQAILWDVKSAVTNLHQKLTINPTWEDVK
jgi:hypothetical protein